MNEIYLVSSPLQGEDEVVYMGIKERLKRYGEVIGPDPKENRIFAHDYFLFIRAKKLVAQITNPDSGLKVGQAIGRILERNYLHPSGQKRQILCLYGPKFDENSFPFLDIQDILNYQYKNLEEAVSLVDKFFTLFEKKQSTA